MLHFVIYSFFCHSELDSESHSWMDCDWFVLSPDGERVRVRGRWYIVTLNFTKRTAATKWGRVCLYAELIQSRIIERIARDWIVFNYPRAGDSESRSALLRCSEWRKERSPYGIFPIPAFPKSGKEYLVTLNSIQSCKVERIAKGWIVFNYPHAGDSESRSALLRCSEWRKERSPYGLLPIPAFPKSGKEPLVPLNLFRNNILFIS